VKIRDAFLSQSNSFVGRLRFLFTIF
jgi:hypothetical protein